MRPHDFDWRLRTKESHEEMGRFKLADQNARIKAIRREKCLPSIQNELDRIAEAMRLFECYASKRIFGTHRYRFGYLKDGR